MLNLPISMSVVAVIEVLNAKTMKTMRAFLSNILWTSSTNNLQQGNNVWISFSQQDEVYLKSKIAPSDFLTVPTQIGVIPANGLIEQSFGFNKIVNAHLIEIQESSA